jgi:excisionase family DNA binding protein
VNDREVSLERFATLLLKETVRQAIRDAMPELSRVEDVSSRSPLPQMPQATARVVSVEETARTLGLKPSTIRAWILARKITSVRLGRRVMIPKQAIDELLEMVLIPARKQN